MRRLIGTLVLLALASALPSPPLKTYVLNVKDAFPKRAVICPGGAAACPSGNTCCLMDDGTYGCCPLPDAVCCADHVHCCNKGQECVNPQGICRDKRGGETRAATRTPAIPIPPHLAQHVTEGSEVELASLKVHADAPQGQDVVCPDGSACDSGNTCCSDGDGGYGCCPLNDAVCCPDHVHCCPHGDVCDNGCVSPSGVLTQLQRMELSPAKDATVSAKGGDVPCPDGSVCDSGNTCCSDGDGGYGCCPLNDAVCCPDHVHCCPHGTVCNNGCVSSIAFLNLIPHVSVSKKQPQQDATTSLSGKGGDVKCPDGSACPSGSTCCSQGDGSFGCCPYSSAVCCDDYIHCCPHGSVCDNGCVTVASPMEMIKNMKVTSHPVVCPGNVYECPSGHTCCKMTDGSFGCCQYPDAVCCSDNVHCCPQGNTCDLTTATCNVGNSSTPWTQSSVKKAASKIVLS